MKDTVRTYVTCPRCQSAELLFKEVTEAVETWAQDADGKITETDETGALLGRVIRIEAECRDPKCGHKWTVRRVNAITELPNWPKGEGGAEEPTDEQKEEVTAAPASETNEGEAAEGQAEAEAAPAQPEAATEPVKKRGRQKGSKNKEKKAA